MDGDSESELQNASKNINNNKEASGESSQDLKSRLEKLENESAFLEKVINYLPAIVYIFDVDLMGPVWVNKPFKEFLGYNPEGLSILDDKEPSVMIHRDDLKNMISDIKEWNQDDKKKHFGYMRLKSGEGDWHYFNTMNIPFKNDDQGRIKQILGIALDITEPVNSEHEIRLLASQDIEKTKQLLVEFTDRELETLSLLKDGKSYDEISEEMNLSLDGVRYHIRNVYNKLDVNSRTEAITKGLKYRIIHP